MNPNNAFPILEYRGEEKDNDQLLKVIEGLEYLRKEEDVQITLKDRFGIEDVLLESKIL